jgi:L-rhamnose mutarotase
MSMPIYLDGHDMKGLSQNDIEKTINSKTDEFGVTNLELFYNKDENKLYCILEAPNEEAVWKHHEKFGIKCQFVTIVEQIKTEKAIKAEKMLVMGRVFIQTKS